MTELELVRIKVVSPAFLQDKREYYPPMEFLAPRIYSNSCRYKNLRRIESDDKKIYMESWNQKVVDSSDQDQYYTVQLEDENRLDRISNYFYNTPNFWWVIAMANSIIDPFNVTIGTSLRIPVITSLYNSGGVLSGN